MAWKVVSECPKWQVPNWQNLYVQLTYDNSSADIDSVNCQFRLYSNDGSMPTAAVGVYVLYNNQLFCIRYRGGPSYSPTWSSDNKTFTKTKAVVSGVYQFSINTKEPVQIYSDLNGNNKPSSVWNLQALIENNPSNTATYYLIDSNGQSLYIPGPYTNKVTIDPPVISDLESNCFLIRFNYGKLTGSCTSGYENAILKHTWTWGYENSSEYTSTQEYVEVPFVPGDTADTKKIHAKNYVECLYRNNATESRSTEIKQYCSPADPSNLSAAASVVPKVAGNPIPSLDFSWTNPAPTNNNSPLSKIELALLKQDESGNWQQQTGWSIALDNAQFDISATGADDSGIITLPSSTETYTNTWKLRTVGLTAGTYIRFAVKAYASTGKGSVVDANGNELSSHWVFSDPVKVPGGIFRVKLGDVFKEGQVYVCKNTAAAGQPENLEWKTAEVVYVLSDGKWKESI